MTAPRLPKWASRPSLARLGQLLDSLEKHAPILMSKSDKRVVKIGLLFKSREGFAVPTPHGPENGRGPGVRVQ